MSRAMTNPTKVFGRSMNPDQPAHLHSLIRIHALFYLTNPIQVEKPIANSMDPDQTARICMLVWIHAGRKTHYVGFVMARLNFINYINNE
jgi:hypothetical protein